MTVAKKPLVLLILDGWGYRTDPEHNAVLAANTPVLDRLWQTCPHTLISGSGMDVGLPDGQMGNSEVGHVNLGSGRIVYQDFTRVTKAISDGEFFNNPALCQAVDKANANQGAVHIMGLLSPGGVHSHEDHISAMVKLAVERGAAAVYVHAFLDGRDTPPRSAHESLAKLEQQLAATGKGRIATVVGRYYAMDRDNRWDRVSKAYHLMLQGVAEFTATTAVDALAAAYQRDENDEFVKPTAIVDAQGHAATINDGDAVIFMNFRADRARQLTRTFIDASFDSFHREKVANLADFVMLTEYSADLKTSCAYPPSSLHNVLGEWLEKHNKTQLRISETEKYAHVTFFFSGGREQTFVGEDRILVPSPDVATYDLQPEMNSTLLTDKLVDAIVGQQYDVIICNYPNGDMVGHTGVFSAAVQACEAVDRCIGRVIDALAQVGGECLITADHGNAEQMVDHDSGQAHTAHTSEPVQFIYYGRPAVAATSGVLSDVAPTMLALMGLPQPAEMTGKSLMHVQG